MPVGWEDYSTSSQPAYKSTNVPLLLLPLPFHYPWEQKTSITESSRVTTRQIENPSTSTLLDQYGRTLR